jgi:hypothetical protein
VTAVEQDRLTADIGELGADGHAWLGELVAARSGQVIRNKWRPRFRSRLLLKFLFTIEQSLPGIRRRLFGRDEFPWSQEL